MCSVIWNIKAESKFRKTFISPSDEDETRRTTSSGDLLQFEATLAGDVSLGGLILTSYPCRPGGTTPWLRDSPIKGAKPAFGAVSLGPAALARGITP